MRSSILGLTLLSLAAGCETTHHARVSHGAGLDEGSPVLVSGVRVGEVREVRVVEGEVDVAFVIGRDHDVTLREDSCALAMPREGGPGALTLSPGTGAPLTEPRTIPQCELPSSAIGDLARDLGGTLGEVLRSLTEGILGGGASPPGSGPLPLPLPGLPGLPSPPSPPSGPSGPSDPGDAPTDPPPPPDLPPPPSFDGVCAGLTMRVDGVERAGPALAHLPQGGHRVWLEVRNDTERTMRVGSIAQATFTDAERRALRSVNLPGEPEAWLMPFDVPARGVARRSVIFAGRDRPRLDEVEARRSAPADDPLAWCTVRATGLAR